MALAKDCQSPETPHEAVIVVEDAEAPAIEESPRPTQFNQMISSILKDSIVEIQPSNTDISQQEQTQSVAVSRKLESYDNRPIIPDINSAEKRLLHQAQSPTFKTGSPVDKLNRPSEHLYGDSPRLIACQYCGRNFNERAAERHIPICANIKARPKPPPSTVEVVRQSIDRRKTLLKNGERTERRTSSISDLNESKYKLESKIKQATGSLQQLVSSDIIAEL